MEQTEQEKEEMKKKVSPYFSRTERTNSLRQKRSQHIYSHETHIYIYDTLILVGQSKELFTHFKQDDIAGLQLTDCLDYHETPGDVFVAGMCNSVGAINFIFLNEMRLSQGTVEASLLVMHECMHLSFLLGIEDEEEIISFAEEISKKILSFLGFSK